MLAAAALFLMGADDPRQSDVSPAASRTLQPAAAARVNAPLRDPPLVDPPASSPAAPVSPAASAVPTPLDLLAADPANLRQTAARTLPTIALFTLASLVPAGLLMATAFVRISVVLMLLRQALGSPQIPGNQVLSALALLLTALVMMPVFEQVYQRGVAPALEGTVAPAEAWIAGTAPIKVFMIDQIVRTHHQDYLWRLYDHVTPPSPGQADPADYSHFPLRVVAPAFLLSELTTALVIGFGIYLPFLVIDLVVSAVLAAMGLFMLPPALVGLPLKLILFALADGWMLVADMLIRSFEVTGQGG
jgi:flagellar biosynthetic protein FliP